jgi:hypothetical protein
MKKINNNGEKAMIITSYNIPLVPPYLPSENEHLARDMGYPLPDRMTLIHGTLARGNRARSHSTCIYTSRGTNMARSGR